MLCVLSLYNYACVYKDFVPVSVSIVITPWVQYGKPLVVLTGTQDASARTASPCQFSDTWDLLPCACMCQKVVRKATQLHTQHLQEERAVLGGIRTHNTAVQAECSLYSCGGWDVLCKWLRLTQSECYYSILLL